MDISPESLKYLEACLRIATQSYAGYAAVICVIIAVCFYFISIRTDGFSRFNLIAYLFTLAFFGAVGYATFSSFQSIKQIFYAGYDNGPFNVGYFSKRGGTIWEDSALEVVPKDQGDPQQSPSLYDYCYVLDGKSSEKDLLVLKRFPNPCSTPPEAADAKAVTIEIDLAHRKVYYINDEGQRQQLYDIMAVL
jgi:hypothetical protein